MATYYLPFTEVSKGTYTIEANSIEEAKALANDVNYVMDLEADYDSGNTTWDAEEIEEA
jgi:hypothetical protein